MKHLLNNLSEGEKKDILAKYDGTLQVNTDKFIRLLESKLGDVKPYEYLNESREGNGKPYGYDKPTGKIYKTPKDPYQYQILKCKWHAKDGPKDKFLKDWTQVPEDGEKELNRRFPKAMIDSSCKEDSSRKEDVCLGVKKSGLYTKEGEYWIEYHTDGFCYMNKTGANIPSQRLKDKEGTIKGRWTCTNNKLKCTPLPA